MTYATLDTDGTERAFTPKGKRPSLEEMQGIVGGYIERVRIIGGEMWVNEEGLLHGLPVNVAATALAGQFIVGRVLVARRKVRGKA